MNLIFNIHSINYLSAFIQFIIAFLVLSRNPKNHASQFLFLTIIGLGFYEFFDGLIITIQIDFPNMLNFIRDVSIILLILSIEFALFSVLIMKFGEKRIRDKRFIIFWIIFTFFVIFFGISDETVIVGTIRAGFHLNITRSVVGWISITGTILTFSSIILLLLIHLNLRQIKDNVEKKFLFFSLGLFLVVTQIMIFDLGVFIELLNAAIAKNVYFHILIHITLLSGQLLVLFAFWKPFKEKTIRSIPLIQV